ncbi:hypothetical protein [Sphingobacterium sp.]|uniref:hypothetical protein n=1 Tax=Sphingobacterium sp. TaxID=341027 RepID=UPI0031CF5B56
MERKQKKKADYVAPVINSYEVEMEEGIAAGSGSSGILSTGDGGDDSGEMSSGVL